MERQRYSNILTLGATALFLGIVSTVLFYEQGLGLNFSLFVAIVAISGLFLSHIFSQRTKQEQYLLIGIALFFSLMVFVHSSELLTFFNIVGCTLLFLIITNTFVGKQIREYLPSEYIRLLFLPLHFVKSFFKTFLEMVSLRGIFGEHSRTKEIVRGSIMAVVAIVIFGALFASADAVFEKIISHIFTFKLSEDIVGRFIFGAVVSLFFIGTFGFMFRSSHSSAISVSGDKLRNLGSVETAILLGSINVLFFLFIILQLTYLFGGESHFASAGLTYAEYARKGFFELILVAILSYLIISFAETQVVKKEKRHLLSFKIASALLVAQVILILISAFMRLSLYENAYGFTEIRLYSYALMIWIAVILVLLSHHIWTNGERTVFAFRTFCTIVLLLFAMNMLNPDIFIAKKNLKRYADTGTIDAKYLASLSNDALPYTIHLLDDPDEIVRKDFADGLYWKIDHMSKRTWQSMHFNQAQSEKLLESRRNTIEKNKEVSLSLE
ncbi:MAG TPA: DUF4173 domain-containing protein [Candidatus Paceibacterota bacterium]